ncbi:polysaccharide deacetylase family protein [Ilyomonas limi]|nr:polysaccharide deacetylase family protein [Ilyomonas limi]
MAGVFTISLDFELHWGVFDKRDRKSRLLCYQNTIRTVPKMLALFEAHGVHVTWATVGSMFASDAEEWNQLKPSLQPEYANEGYSPYRWVAQHGLQPEYHVAHFAPDAVKSILQYKGQELGTHTFSHYYCLEQVKQPEAFEADLKAANAAALKFGTQTTSLIFPRNQYNAQALRVCYENGIRVVRSNPDARFWTPINDKDASLLRKVLRTGDAYIQLGSTRSSYPLTAIAKRVNEPMLLPASRFLRPWHPAHRFTNKLMLRRINKELETAAKLHECYHLWWHPENFGDFPQENLENLAIVLEQYKKYRQKYGMQSWNMGEYEHHLADKYVKHEHQVCNVG